MSEMKFGRPELKLGDNIKREIALLNKKEFDQTILQPDKSDPETKPDTRQGFLISEKSLTVRLRTHNQNRTVAARAIADMKTFGHLS